MARGLDRQQRYQEKLQNKRLQTAEEKLFGKEYKRKGSTGRTKSAFSADDISFLNDPRNKEFRQQLINEFADRPRGGQFQSMRDTSSLAPLTERILDRRGELSAQDFFAENPRPTYSPLDIQNMIAQQSSAPLQGLPTVQGFQQGVLPMLQGGFQTPTAPPVFGQGGGMFAGTPQMSQGVLGNLATQGMGQMATGQTMNPTLFRGKV